MQKGQKAVERKLRKPLSVVAKVLSHRESLDLAAADQKSRREKGYFCVALLESRAKGSASKDWA